MGIYIATGSAFSVIANSKSVDQVTGQYQFIQKSNLSIFAKPSAAGMSMTLKVNGVSLIDDLELPGVGATGGLTKIDNQILQQIVAGGRVELFFRNTTGATLTVDYILEFEPQR